jgi:hypothetical protein
MLQMLLTLSGIDDLHGLVSTWQTFPDEGEQYAILFVVFAKTLHTCRISPRGASERDWQQRLLHLQVLPLEVALRITEAASEI